jgi:hypothetical protein
MAHPQRNSQIVVVFPTHNVKNVASHKPSSRKLATRACRPQRHPRRATLYWRGCACRSRRRSTSIRESVGGDGPSLQDACRLFALVSGRCPGMVGHPAVVLQLSAPSHSSAGGRRCWRRGALPMWLNGRQWPRHRPPLAVTRPCGSRIPDASRRPGPIEGDTAKS